MVHAAMLPSSAYQTVNPVGSPTRCCVGSGRPAAVLGRMSAVAVGAVIGVWGQEEGREHEQPHGVDEVPVQAEHFGAGVVTACGSGRSMP